MIVADETMMVKVVAIGKIAKRILQTTSADIFRLSQLDQSYALDTLSSEFEGRTFLMLLRRTFNQQNEGNKNLLLLDFLDHSNIVENSNSSNQDIWTSSSSASQKEKATEIQLSPLSPFKRQLSQITLSTESDDTYENNNSKDTLFARPLQGHAHHISHFYQQYIQYC
ncbi:hypothetical protein LIER_38529 [Lithospermum erythrorhizon]|uniref:Uncharacterized protein n=1 Tax=Lithospermum erythrorhizon TaxID=34254 RepID=A0AAV3Q1N9_LITER